MGLASLVLALLTCVLPVQDAEREARLAAAMSAVEAAKTTHGARHPETARALNSLGEVLYGQGSVAEARSVFETALAIREQALGAEHIDVAEALNNLAIVLKRQGDLPGSRDLHERALAIREASLGSEHELVATSLHNISSLLHEQGLYAEAREQQQRAMAIREKVLGPDHPDTMRGLGNFAAILEALGEFEEARALHERVLDFRERNLGPDHPDVANSLANLGAVLERLGQLDEATQLQRRALAIREQMLGANHPLTAYSLNGLGAVLQRQGHYQEARPLFERALAVFEQSLGTEHPLTAQCQGNLALVLFAQGNDEDAAPINARAIENLEASLGTDHPQIALLLNNQAMVHHRRGRLDEARPLYQRALAIWEQSLGPDHHRVGLLLNNLAGLHQAQGRLAEAEQSFERAHAIARAVFERGGPAVARSLTNLARINQLRGEIDVALERCREAVAMNEEILGTEHPESALAYARLTQVLMDAGDLETAWEVGQKSVASREAHRRRLAWTLSEFERLEFAKQQADALSTLLSVAQAIGTADVERQAYEIVLRWKGQVARSLLTTRGAILGTLDDESRARVDTLQRIQSELSRVLYEPGDLGDSIRAERVAALREERKQLEREWARSLGATGSDSDVGVAELAAALPPGSAGVDFYIHGTYMPAVHGEDGSFLPGRENPPQLTAWIVRAGSEDVTRVVLGEARTLAEDTRSLLQAVVPAGTARGRSIAPAAADRLTTTNRQLLERLWHPLTPHLSGVDRIFVSPDTFLGTLPFEILQLEDDSYLLEHIAFVYLQDMPALARMTRSAPGDESTLLVVGGVDYDARDDALPDGPDAEADLPMLLAMRGPDGDGWAPLPATVEEADRVAALHDEIVETTSSRVQRAAATEERMKSEIPRHAVVHLATHGFFQTDTAELDAGGSSPQLGFDDLQPSVAGQFPGLLSGLVFAGANTVAEDGRDDGYLTAEEITFMDLSGVDLVVLSACETGLGLAQAGEGMLGLRRSFRQAGAATVVSSLWSVEDEATRELMLHFYDRLWRRGQGKLEALRGARLDLLEANRANHGGLGLPSTWGAFVLDGDWN